MNGLAPASIPQHRPVFSAREPTGLMAVGFWCFAFFLFAFFSRVFDLYFPFLHLPSITQGIAFAIALFSGRLLCSLATAAGKCMLALTVWFVCSIPFSTWRGGSFGVMMNVWLKTVAIFVIATALVVTFKQSRRVLFVIGLATAAGALLVTLKGEMDLGGGRLSVQGSRFQNANEIAMMMALGLPFLWLLIVDSRAHIFRKAAGAGMMLLVLGTMMRTGSRAGLLGLIVLTLSLLARLSMEGKAKMFMGLAVAGVVFVVVVPHTIKERYLTLVHAEREAVSAVEAQQVGKAEASAAARWEKFMQSLRLTAEHPLFGVGLGNFAVVVDSAAHMRGQFTDWGGTHNSYTQLSSEAGIPAVVLFVAVLAFCLKNLTQTARRARKLNSVAGRDFANTAYALRDSFFVFIVSAWFAHVAYQPTMPVLAAIAVSLVRAAEVELPALEGAAERVTEIAQAPGVWRPRRPLSSPAAAFSDGPRRDFGGARV